MNPKQTDKCNTKRSYVGRDPMYVSRTSQRSEPDRITEPKHILSKRKKIAKLYTYNCYIPLSL